MTLQHKGAFSTATGKLHSNQIEARNGSSLSDLSMKKADPTWQPRIKMPPLDAGDGHVDGGDGAGMTGRVQAHDIVIAAGVVVVDAEVIGEGLRGRDFGGASIVGVKLGLARSVVEGCLEGEALGPVEPNAPAILSLFVRLDMVGLIPGAFGDLGEDAKVDWVGGLLSLSDPAAHKSHAQGNDTLMSKLGSVRRLDGKDSRTVEKCILAEYVVGGMAQ